MKDNPTVTVLVMVEAGSKYEKKEINGLSHFLEHMCFKGTTKRPKAIDIARELDSIGADYNAFTAQEFTGYFAKSDYKHLDTVLDVVSDIYLHSTFPDTEIEKEKGVIVEEINMYQDIPQKYVQDIFLELLYGDNPAGWNVAGSKETVKAMKRSDFLSYREAHYVASNTSVIIAGSFDEKAIEEKVALKFEKIEKGKKSVKDKVHENQLSPALKILSKKTDQTHFVLGVRSFDVHSKKNPAVKIIETILGGGMSSRLFQKLRDELGATYYVRAENVIFTDHGYFNISAGVDKKRLTEVVEAILQELRNLVNFKVDAVELKKAKDYITGTTYLSLESSDSLAEYFGFQEVLKHDIQSPQEFINKIQQVTSDEVFQVASELFINKNLNLALIGGVKKSDKIEKILNI